MVKSISIAILLSLSGSIFAQEVSLSDSWQRLRVLKRPAQVQVLTGIDLEIEGVKCRLFGVKLPDGEKDEKLAKRFLELYVKDYGGYFSIYNDGTPISDSDGVPLIWYDGHGNGGWAQEVLLQAGLVQPNFESLSDYTFYTPTKSGSSKYPWKRTLKNAVKSHLKHEKPNVNFQWPELSQ